MMTKWECQAVLSLAGSAMRDMQERNILCVRVLSGTTANGERLTVATAGTGHVWFRYGGKHAATLTMRLTSTRGAAGVLSAMFREIQSTGEFA